MRLRKVAGRGGVIASMAAAMLVLGCAKPAPDLPDQKPATSGVFHPGTGESSVELSVRIWEACRAGTALEFGAGWGEVPEPIREGLREGLKVCPTLDPTTLSLVRGEPYSAADAKFLLTLLVSPHMSLQLSEPGVQAFDELGLVDRCSKQWRELGSLVDGQRVAFTLKVRGNQVGAGQDVRVSCALMPDVLYPDRATG